MPTCSHAGSASCSLREAASRNTHTRTYPNKSAREHARTRTYTHARAHTHMHTRTIPRFFCKAERTFEGPQAAAESLFVTTSRSSSHVLCKPSGTLLERSAEGETSWSGDAEGILFTNESEKAHQSRDACRRALANSTAGAPRWDHVSLGRDCSGRKDVRETREAEFLQVARR